MCRPPIGIGLKQNCTRNLRGWSFLSPDTRSEGFPGKGQNFSDPLPVFRKFSDPLPVFPKISDPLLVFRKFSDPLYFPDKFSDPLIHFSYPLNKVRNFSHPLNRVSKFSYPLFYVCLVGDWVSPTPIHSGCGRDITLRSTQGVTTLTSTFQLDSTYV